MPSADPLFRFLREKGKDKIELTLGRSAAAVLIGFLALVAILSSGKTDILPVALKLLTSLRW
jgi:hypothetical protein